MINVAAITILFYVKFITLYKFAIKCDFETIEESNVRFIYYSCN